MTNPNYLEGYAQGLKRGNETPIVRDVNLALDNALGNPHESAKNGLQQGVHEMEAAKEAESKRKPMKKGGKVLAAKGGNVRGHGIEQRGKTKGKFI